MAESEAGKILDGVKEILAAREANYDDPAANFDRIARTWNVMLEAAGKLAPGAEIDALDVARMMVCMKMARDAFRFGADNWDDTIGYGVCGRRIGDEALKEMLSPRGPGPVVPGRVAKRPLTDQEWLALGVIPPGSQEPEEPEPPSEPMGSWWEWKPDHK